MGAIRMIKYNKNNFVQKIGDEIILHSEKTGNNIFLNETATVIYENIHEGVSMDNLLTRIASIYNEEKETILSDVKQTIDTLVEEGVLLVESEEL